MNLDESVMPAAEQAEIASDAPDARSERALTVATTEKGGAP
jgi:hypothetical protein